MAALEDIALLEARTRMENMWGDDQIRKNYTAKADTLNAILSKQTARATVLNNGRKDQDVEVNWITLADQTVTTFDPATGTEICNISGPELEAGKEIYSLKIGTEKTFQIVEEGSADKAGLRGTDAEFQELASRGLLQARKALVEDANARVIAKLGTYAGTNKYLGGYTADVNGDTVVPGADYGAAKLLPYLARVQMMNKYVDPYILDGGLLWDDLYLANAGAREPNSVQLQTLFNQFDITEDMWGFAQADVEDRSYLVDRNAVAFFSKNHYAYTGGVIDRGNNGRKDYAIALPELGSRVYADVAYQYKCVGNEWVHAWKLMLRYDLLANPVIGDADLTGVLALVKGA